MVEIFNYLRTCNYWDKAPENLGLERPSYLDLILNATGNRLIKVLLGQRRVGKSYILRQVIHALIRHHQIPPQNIFYLNKELLEFDAIRDYKDLKTLITYYETKLKISGKIFILLDEVQQIDGWEKVVNALSQDHKKEYEVFITGSNSNLLSGELATYLSGRYIAFDIQSFSYDEYAKMTHKEKNKQSYIAYLQDGGLPELFHLQDTETRLHYVMSLYDTIILKDVVNRYKIRDIYLIERIFKYLSDNISNLFSINRVVDYLNTHKIKTNFETVSNYILYLSQAFLFHEVERYDLKGKTILASTKKYYLNDLSFKNYFSSGYDFGLGKQLENAIYLHFRRQGYKLYVGKIGDKEVDFIAEKGPDKKYIQVAFSLSDESVIQREFTSLEKIHDAYEKWVITLDDFSLGNRNGIKHIQAWTLE